MLVYVLPAFFKKHEARHKLRAGGQIAPWNSMARWRHRLPAANHSHLSCAACETDLRSTDGEQTMLRPWKLAIALGVCSVCTWFSSDSAQAQVAKPKGLGEAGALATLKVEPNINEKGVTIRGRDSRQQVFVTGTYSWGQLHDHTRKVVYSAQPEGIVKIDANGTITPTADGTTTVTAKDAASGLAANLTVTVTDIAGDRPINFGNQVV